MKHHLTLLRFVLVPVLVSIEGVQARKLQTIDEVCSVFASDIKHPNGGEGTYHCDCSGNATVFTASCSYDRYECASWPGESARAYTVDYSFTSNYANGEATEDSEECLFFRSTCNQVCMGYLEGSFYATIDGARCNSITLCDAASSQDFLLDCNNLVPGLVMNTCNGTGIKGSPFELFEPNIYATSLYESGSCGQRNAIPNGFEASHCEQENTVDDACEQYANSLNVSNGSGGEYVCDCSGSSVRNFEATCGDLGSECVQSPNSTAKYNVNYTFVTPFRDSVESGEVQECIFFLETCNEICVGWKEATGFYATVDGDQCNSMTLCNRETSDFVLDCRNLLPEALLNTCTGEGVQGSPFEPFEPDYYAKSTYVPGSCSDGQVPRGLSTENCIGGLPSVAPSQISSSKELRSLCIQGGSVVLGAILTVVLVL